MALPVLLLAACASDDTDDAADAQPSAIEGATTEAPVPTEDGDGPTDTDTDADEDAESDEDGGDVPVGDSDEGEDIEPVDTEAADTEPTDVTDDDFLQELLDSIVADDDPYCQAFGDVIKGFIGVSFTLDADVADEAGPATENLSEAAELLIYPSLLEEAILVSAESPEEIATTLAPLFDRIGQARDILFTAGFEQAEYEEIVAAGEDFDFSELDLDALEPRFADAAAIMVERLGPFEEFAETLDDASDPGADAMEAFVADRCPVLSESLNGA